jgi:hypothetical protein
MQHTTAIYAMLTNDRVHCRELMTRYEALDRLVLLRKLMGHQIMRLEGVTGALPPMWGPQGLDPQDPVLQVGEKIHSTMYFRWVGNQAGQCTATSPNHPHNTPEYTRLHQQHYIGCTQGHDVHTVHAGECYTSDQRPTAPER